MKTSLLKFRSILFYILLVTGFSGQAQQELSMKEAILLALENNFNIREAVLEYEQSKLKHKSLAAIPKTEISVLVGQYNSIVRGDNNIGISQTIPFPTTFFKAGSLGNAISAGQHYKTNSTKNDVIYQVSGTYIQLSYLKEKHKLLQQEDSLFRALVSASTLRYQTGESTLLEKTEFETRQQEVINSLRLNESEIKIHQASLMALLNTENLIDSNTPLQVLDIRFNPDTSSIHANPFIRYLNNEIETADQQKKYDVSKALPDLKLGFFSQTLIGNQSVDGQDVYFGSDDRFTGFEVGLSLPIFFGSHRAQVKSAEIKKELAGNNLRGYQNKMNRELDQAKQEYNKYRNSLSYYQNTAIPNADLIEKQTRLAFQGGDIDYTTLLLHINRVISIQHSYISTILNYNLSILKLEYLIGNPTHEE